MRDNTDPTDRPIPDDDDRAGVQRRTADYQPPRSLAHVADRAAAADRRLGTRVDRQVRRIGGLRRRTRYRRPPMPRRKSSLSWPAPAQPLSSTPSRSRSRSSSCSPSSQYPTSRSSTPIRAAVGRTSWRATTSASWRRRLPARPAHRLHSHCSCLHLSRRGSGDLGFPGAV